MFYTDSLPTIHLTHLCLNGCKRLADSFITFQNRQDTHILLRCIWTLLLKQNSASDFVFFMGSLSESFTQKLQGQPPQSRTNPFSQTSAPTWGTPSQSLKNTHRNSLTAPPSFRCLLKISWLHSHKLNLFVEFTLCWNTRPVRINHSPLGSIWFSYGDANCLYFYKNMSDKGHTSAPRSTTGFYCECYCEYIKTWSTVAGSDSELKVCWVLNVLNILTIILSSHFFVSHFLKFIW